MRGRRLGGVLAEYAHVRLSLSCGCVKTALGVLFFIGYKSGRAFPLSLDHSDKSRYAHHADHSADIIGENREAHLCFDVLEAFGQEVGRPHPRL